MTKSWRMETGYVALLAVLIMGSIATSIAVTLLLTGVDSQRSGLTEQQSKQARAYAVACADEALMVMHGTASYTGTNNMSFSQGSCTYIVTNGGGNSRTILATGTVGNVVKKVQVYATIGASSISITSWQEVV